MLQNPYLAVPQIESPSSRSWSAGFLYGFQGPEASLMQQADVPSEDGDAFNEGVLAGQNAMFNGLDLAETCIDLNRDAPSFPHFAVDGVAEASISAGTLLGAHYMALFGEGILAVVNLSITVETFFDDPDAALFKWGNRLQEELTTLGFTEPMTLYFGGGIDLDVLHCELQATSNYREQSAAVVATQALGRKRWMVGKWRTDQCGGLSVVEADGF